MSKVTIKCNSETLADVVRPNIKKLNDEFSDIETTLIQPLNEEVILEKAFFGGELIVGIVGGIIVTYAVKLIDYFCSKMMQEKNIKIKVKDEDSGKEFNLPKDIDKFIDFYA